MYVRPAFYDDFNRPDGALLSPWVALLGEPVIFDGGLTGVECAVAMLPFTGENFAVSAELSSFTSGTLATLLLKCNDDATNGFSISVQDDLTLNIEATVDGTATVIASTDAISVGDSFGLYHFTENGIQKLRATKGIYTLAEIEVPEAFLSLKSGTKCGVWVSAGSLLGDFTAEEPPIVTLPLVPLQKSWAANQVEQELKDLFIRLYDELLSSQADEIAVYGMPHIGPFSLIERLVTQDGLAVIRQGDEAGMRYLYEAWKFKNPKRGMHFLRTYLQVLFGNAWDTQQLWQDKAEDYPFALKTEGQINLAEESFDDYFLTSRIRVDLNTDLIPNNVIQSLRTALAARFVLEMRIAKFFETEWFLGAFATASVLFDGNGISMPPDKNAALAFTFINLATASAVFCGSGNLIGNIPTEPYYLPTAIGLFEMMDVEPSSTLKQKINDLIYELKVKGIWDLLDTLYVPIRGEDQQAMRLDWKRAGKTAGLHDGATVSSEYGFEATAGGGYVDTDYNSHPSADGVNATRDNWLAFAWVTKVPTDAADIFYRGGNDASLFVLSDEDVVGHTNTATIVSGTPMVQDELYSIGRLSSVSSAMYEGDTEIASSGSVSTAWMGSDEGSNTLLLQSASTDNQRAVGVFGMGAYLDEAKLAQLKTAIQNYLAA